MYVATILIPVPDTDCDVTEVAVPWAVLTRAGHHVVFATEAGAVPRADPLLLTGVLFGKLGAEPEAKTFYHRLESSDEWRRPLRWADLDVAAFDGMILPGGHAPGMRQFLGSAQLQAKVAEFWNLGRPVGAICHGVLVLARATDANGTSLLFGRTTTRLPGCMEWAACLITAWKLGRYSRTYRRTSNGRCVNRWLHRMT